MRQRPAVHQFQLATQRYPVGNPRSDQAFVVEQLSDVMRRRLALNRRVGGEDDFGKRARFFNPRDQLRNADGLRPEAVQR